METIFVLWIFFYNDGIKTESVSQHSVGPFATLQHCQAAAKGIQKPFVNKRMEDEVDTNNFRMACIPVLKEGIVGKIATTALPSAKIAPTPSVRNEADRHKICTDFTEDLLVDMKKIRDIPSYQEKDVKKKIFDRCWDLESIHIK